MFFIPFYCLGNVYNCLLEKYDNLNNIVYFIVVLGIQFLVVMHYGWVPTFSAVFGTFFGNPIMQYIVAINGIAFWLRIAKIITPIVNEESYLLKLGRNSFTIMMHHIAIIYILEIILYYFNKVTGVLGDIDINTIKTSAGSWYILNGNQHFLLFYLIMTLISCVCIKDIGIKLKKLCFKNKQNKGEK